MGAGLRWPEVRTWGSTAEERRATFACDRHLPRHDDALFRAVTVAAPAALLFRWLGQLRVAPYSYDWIDNFGRRSPRQLTAGLDDLRVGQPVRRRSLARPRPTRPAPRRAARKRGPPGCGTRELSGKAELSQSPDTASAAGNTRATTRPCRSISIVPPLRSKPRSSARQRAL